jgi:hypothetical protein
MAGKPLAPAGMVKLMDQSSKLSLRLVWQAVAVPAGESPAGDILGYTLYMTDVSTGLTTVAFNGTAHGLKT